MIFNKDFKGARALFEEKYKSKSCIVIDKKDEVAVSTITSWKRTTDTRSECNTKDAQHGKSLTSGRVGT
jgi:hypothetical protein